MNEALSVVLLIVVPLASALLIAALGPKRPDAVRWTALASTLLSLLVSLIVALIFATERYEGTTDLTKFEPKFETNIIVLPLEKASAREGAEAGAIRFHVGLDGLSVWLVVLTTLLMVCAVLGSWTAISERINEYYAWMLALQMAMVGVFLSLDVILFYVFFELTLIPLFFLIGIWGGSQRQYAARKFFVFTFAGSLITLLGVFAVILSLYGYTNELTFSIPRLASLSQEVSQGSHAKEWIALQWWIFAAMMVGFSVKVPLFPVHTWLPLAHVEAPTAGSVLLAGVLLKLGTYGFLRLCIPLLPDASIGIWNTFSIDWPVQYVVWAAVLLVGALVALRYTLDMDFGFVRQVLQVLAQLLLCLLAVVLVFVVAGVWKFDGRVGDSRVLASISIISGAPLICTLAVIGIIYGAFCALMQDDIKKMIAYSSVSHLGVCMLGMFALNEVGMMGSLLQMINHGLSTGALFLLVGMLYERYHTRQLADYSGMAARLKLLAAAFVFITMSSIGLPGLNGFIGELTSLLGIFSSKVQSINGVVLAALGTTGVILGAWYMLSLVRDVFFGPVKEPHHEGHAVGDLNGREIALLAPIAILCVVIGLYSPGFTKVADPEIKYVAKLTKEAQKRQETSSANRND